MAFAATEMMSMPGLAAIILSPYSAKEMRRSVLGIDVASGSWSANGSAMIEFDGSGFVCVNPGAIQWSSSLPLTAENLANEIVTFACRHEIAAIALDGPQGWRDPATDPDK